MAFFAFYIPAMWLVSLHNVKNALKSDSLFCLTVPFSALAEKKLPFREKDNAIREWIAPLRANHIARIASDFKMD